MPRRRRTLLEGGALFRIQVAERNPRAFFQEAAHCCRADASRSAGDGNHFSVHSPHLLFLLHRFVSQPAQSAIVKHAVTSSDKSS